MLPDDRDRFWEMYRHIFLSIRVHINTYLVVTAPSLHTWAVGTAPSTHGLWLLPLHTWAVWYSRCSWAASLCQVLLNTVGNCNTMVSVSVSKHETLKRCSKNTKWSLSKRYKVVYLLRALTTNGAALGESVGEGWEDVMAQDMNVPYCGLCKHCTLRLQSTHKITRD